ncbi:AAA family ATPase [Mesobacillus subterraneus]|uniref:AAA family ATPase n=1 Tax=Mesobacillus subterraneus TaxID=285983 RepID=UPI001CFEC21C|nr:AAA family ATPase [Mesobacillus subterraneus]
MQQALVNLTSYIDALRSIIYIQHFDFQSVDELIMKSKDEQATTEIYEFNPGKGYVDFFSKRQKGDYSLKEMLSFIEDFEVAEAYIVLKDVHPFLDNPEIISLLKDISLRSMHDEKYNVTIFIVSTKLVIPDELEPFITVFDMPSPGINEIEELIGDFALKQDILIDHDVRGSLAVSFKGLTAFEIIQILNLAYQTGGTVAEEDKSLILKEKEQIIKKSGMIEIVNFKETIEDIGGLDHLKEWLEQKALIFKKLDKAIKFGVDIPKGTLIVGMPGCGKSLTAKATARLFEVPLLRLDVGKLLGKYIGESEDNMRRALKISEAVSPCVLWIDEIEKAFAGIGEGGHEVTSRLFGYFLTWLQEKDSTVFVVATANDISKLPPEFLRKGRFDELFYVDFPEGEERKKIFEIHLKKRNKWSKDIDTIQLINKTEGFSGADIESVVRDVIEKAFINGRDGIDTQDIIEVIEDTKSLSQLLKDRIEEMKKAIEKIDIKPASR